MKVSASIVIYNVDPDELRLCLECLVNNGIKDIWISDNSPVSTNIKGIISPYPLLQTATLRYIHLPGNPGYGAAHNRAIHEACNLDFDAHLVVNTDIKFGSDVISNLIQVLKSDSMIGQISPRIISPDGTQQYAQRLLPTPLDVFGRRFLPKSIMRHRNSRYLLVNRNDTTPFNIPYHQGSFILFRTEALKAVGGFDERFFMYPEDIDITRRIHKRYITLYYPGVTVVHAHRAQSYKSMRMLRIHCSNMIRYFNKWGWWHDPERRRINSDTLYSMQLDNKGRQQHIEK